MKEEIENIINNIIQGRIKDLSKDRKACKDKNERDKITIRIREIGKIGGKLKEEFKDF